MECIETAPLRVQAPPGRVVVFFNCRVLRGYELVRDEVWVFEGKIIDPQHVKRRATDRIDCRNAIVAPGFIDLQVNGAFGVDFLTHPDCREGLEYVSKRLPETGVTSYAPTLITSPPEAFRRTLAQIKSFAETRTTDSDTARVTVLGAHCEGPFINSKKKGAHPEEFIRGFARSKAVSPTSAEDAAQDGGRHHVLHTLETVYGDLSFVRLVTLAPELPDADVAIRELASKGIVVSLGHSSASLDCAERGIKAGARMITHLFNAMPAFQPRDPSLPGLLCSNCVTAETPVYFGLIADGIHTHEAALRIAYRLAPQGLVLVTDALAPMGLPDGEYRLGETRITVSGTPRCAKVTGTDTLCGCVATMEACVRHFRNAVRCPLGYALAAATLHPARCMRLDPKKGTLDFGADADLILLDDDLFVLRTYVGGVLAFAKEPPA